jgi:serine/threonine-protein kinase HipA
MSHPYLVGELKLIGQRLYTKQIHVYADWLELAGLRKVGVLQAEQLRGKEVFSFSYHKGWLESGFAILLDPDLDLFTGEMENMEEAFRASWHS